MNLRMVIAAAVIIGGVAAGAYFGAGKSAEPVAEFSTVETEAVTERPPAAPASSPAAPPAVSKTPLSHPAPVSPPPALSSKELSAAVKAGKRISDGQCEGEGVPYKLSVSPMRAEDFSYVIPYGTMVGGHVTPIDHQYFSPTVFHSPPDTYEVRAMADAKLVRYEPHPTRIRLIFSVSCTYFYYYDLLTSVVPEINEKSIPLRVKAGELIGHIGGQTLDFAVWDTTKPLAGFVVPEHYDPEPWKLYTADPLLYYTDELRAMILSKYVRIAEPRSGKIDYDSDGKLIGNWFLDGTVNYAGGANSTSAQRYWTGHLAIVPDAYSPDRFFISVGYLEGEGRQNQFSVPKNSPNPATVGVGDGLVKYDFKNWAYLKPDGSEWDKMTRPNGEVTLENERYQPMGCALAELLEPRKLKFETFMGQRCSAVDGFSGSAKIYRR